MSPPCKICGGDCGQCGGPVTDPSHVWDRAAGAYRARAGADPSRMTLPEALALGMVAAGIGIFVFYVIPRIEVAIALFDRLTRGI